MAESSYHEFRANVRGRFAQKVSQLTVAMPMSAVLAARDAMIRASKEAESAGVPFETFDGWLGESRSVAESLPDFITLKVQEFCAREVDKFLGSNTSYETVGLGVGFQVMPDGSVEEFAPGDPRLRSSPVRKSDEIIIGPLSIDPYNGDFKCSNPKIFIPVDKKTD